MVDIKYNSAPRFYKLRFKALFFNFSVKFVVSNQTPCRPQYLVFSYWSFDNL